MNSVRLGVRFEDGLRTHMGNARFAVLGEFALHAATSLNAKRNQTNSPIMSDAHRYQVSGGRGTISVG